MSFSTKLPLVLLLSSFLIHASLGQLLFSVRKQTNSEEVDWDALAMTFIEYYYPTFDTDRSGLANLYQRDSMFSFEGQKVHGSKNIVAKLTSLPFNECHHSISTVDCQPSGVNGGMLVFVTGNLQVDDNQDAFKFSHMFHLIPTPQESYPQVDDNQDASKFTHMFHLIPTLQGSFHVLNEIFRLHYA